MIDAMSASSGGMSERGEATSEICVAMAELAGAMGRRRASIATNGGATRGHVLSIERQAPTIAKKTIAIERVGGLEEAHPSVDKGVSYHKAKTDGRWRNWLVGLCGAALERRLGRGVRPRNDTIARRQALFAAASGDIDDRCPVRIRPSVLLARR